MVYVSAPPSESRQRYFSSAQLEQLKAVFEAIWPGGPDNPGASDAGAADYVDYLLGSDESIYYEIRDWRVLYTAGLAMLGAAALNLKGVQKELPALPPDEMTLLLSDLAAGKLSTFPNAAWQRSFFNTM